VKKWFVLLSGLVAVTSCGSQSSTEGATSVSSKRSLINAASDFSSTRFWVHINDSKVNPWDTTTTTTGGVTTTTGTGKAMTWRALERQNDVTLVGSDNSSDNPTDGTTNAYTGDTLVTSSLPILCLNVNNTPKPSNITTSFYKGWSSGRILLSSPVAGTLLKSLIDANKVCSDQFGTGWRMAEFHDGFHDGSRGGWAFYAVSSFVTIHPKQAARGEQVTATLFGLDPDTASITLDGSPIQIGSKNANKITFTIPKTVDGGTKNVGITSGGRSTTEPLLVYGQASEDEQGNPIRELTAIIDPGKSEDEIKRIVKDVLKMTFISLNPLSDTGNMAAQGPCGQRVLRVQIPAGQSIGESIETLVNQSAPSGITIFDVNPVTAWVVRQSGAPATTTTLMEADHKTEIGLAAAHAANRKGAGVTIAVIDTGVTANTQLGNRLLTPVRLAGTNFTPANNDNDFAKESVGHGTASAVLAAGSEMGVAPAANVVSVRACNQENKCDAMNVARAICHVMARYPADKLVYNLSLGGDTPNKYLKTVMEYAVSKGALIAAAAGNSANLPAGINGAKNYPASESINGLISVGASYSPNLAQQATLSEQNSKISTTDLATLINGTRYQAPYPITAGVGWYTVETNQSPLRIIQFDFGSVRQIKRMDLYPSWFGNSFPQNVFLAVSTTGANDSWTTALASYGNPDRSQGDGPKKFDVNFTARYVKLVIVNTRIWRTLDNNDVVRTLGLSEVEFLGTTWQPAPFSNRNAQVEITAPGVGVTSLSSSGGTAQFYGTSFSTPQVAGALALLRSQYPSLSSADIEAKLLANAKPLPYDKTAVGAGMLDVSKP
jgi:subtilisin family serine protease